MKTFLKENRWTITAVILIILQSILVLVLIYEMGKDSVSSELHTAVDNNLTIRQFYFKTYPDSYKKHFTDWKHLSKIS